MASIWLAGTLIHRNRSQFAEPLGLDDKVGAVDPARSGGSHSRWSSLEGLLPVC